MLVVNADDLNRLMLCNGSRLLQPSFPEGPTAPATKQARDEGTAAHYMASAVFNNEFTIEEIIDRKAPNGVYCTAEMVDHVAAYLSALDCGEVEAETSFGNDDFRINGRCDHRKITETTLTIDEFKYGWRIREPFRNWTLIAHAIGTCIFHAIAPPTIIFRVHQPRPHHPEGKIREWRITYAELMEFYNQIVATLTNPSDMLQTGPQQCPKCPANATCPANRKAGYNAIDASETAFNDAPNDEELAAELDMLKYAQSTIDNRVKSLEELAKHRLKNGAVIPNYATDTAYGNSTWKAGFTAPFLQVMTGVDLSKPGLVTPAEAKRRGVSDEVVKSLTYRPETGLKLVRIDANKRAERIFNKGN